MALAAGADQGDDGTAGGGAEVEGTPPALGKVKEAPGNVLRVPGGRRPRTRG